MKICVNELYTTKYSFALLGTTLLCIITGSRSQSYTENRRHRYETYCYWNTTILNCNNGQKKRNRNFRTITFVMFTFRIIIEFQMKTKQKKMIIDFQTTQWALQCYHRVQEANSILKRCSVWDVGGGGGGGCLCVWQGGRCMCVRLCACACALPQCSNITQLFSLGDVWYQELTERTKMNLRWYCMNYSFFSFQTCFIFVFSLFTFLYE